MATSVMRGLDIQQLCLIGETTVICIIGLMIHLFMTAVGMKGRPLTTADLLITSIAVSRIIFPFVSLFHLFWRTYHEEQSTAYNIAINAIGDSSTDCNIWLSVLLSVFYSLKISNFHNVFFLYLGKIISQRVLSLIVLLVLLSIGFSSGVALTTFLINPENSTQAVNAHMYTTIDYRLLALRTFLPIIFDVISAFTLLVFLCHHMHRMKRDRNGGSHLNGYFNTMTFITVSFLCFALYVSCIVCAGYYYTTVGIAGYFLVWNCIPVLHSVYIIYMTARLRGHFSKILHGVTKCLLLRGGSGSRPGAQIQIICQ